MSGQRGRYLYVVRGGQTSAREVVPEDPPAPASGAADAERAVSSVSEVALSQAIMHAAVGWAALCAAGDVLEVSIQPVGDQLYEVTLGFAGSRSLMVRVRLIVWAGQSVRTVVEPVVP